ncbi:MAG TPA: hypothetical protein VE133_17155 [Candidatus Sulfotelmatobacter sp.]|nr:hypothetical protein [Candidatus Sulfotelmatobacter sp.]
MKFARVVYGIAAAYGIVSLLPLYFMFERVGRDAPPAITHPEFYYGFIGVTLLCQLVFILIAKDPIRYRPIMLISVMEKLIYTVPVIIFYLLGRVHPSIMRTSLVDPVFGLLFIVAYVRTRDVAA